MDDETIRYRPVWGRVLAVAVAAVCLVAAAILAWRAQWDALLAVGPLILLLPALAWACYWRPELLIEAHRLRIVNVLRTVDVAWPAIVRLDTRFALTVTTAERRIGVWAAPAPGVRGTARLQRSDVKGLRESSYADGSVRPGEAVGTASGDAAYLVRRRWEELRDAGHLDRGPEPDSVRITWHWATIALLGALAGLAAASVVVQSLGPP